MPCYNSDSGLSLAIDSVLGQTYEKFELIIVDDFSADDSFAIANSYAEIDSRVRPFRLDTNSGSPAMPRNFGIARAVGEYICFLDSDDEWYPQKLEIQLKFMVENKARFSFTSYDIFRGRALLRVYEAPRKASYNDLLRLNTIGCLTVMLERELARSQAFLDFPVEDFIFWLDILKLERWAFNASIKPLGRYHINGGSRSANKLKLLGGYWKVFYRHENMGALRSAYCLVRYCFNYLLKYR